MDLRIDILVQKMWISEVLQKIGIPEYKKNHVYRVAQNNVYTFQLQITRNLYSILIRYYTLFILGYCRLLTQNSSPIGGKVTK